MQQVGVWRWNDLRLRVRDSMGRSGPLASGQWWIVSGCKMKRKKTGRGREWKWKWERNQQGEGGRGSAESAVCSLHAKQWRHNIINKPRNACHTDKLRVTRVSSAPLGHHSGARMGRVAYHAHAQLKKRTWCLTCTACPTSNAIDAWSVSTVYE